MPWTRDDGEVFYDLFDKDDLKLFDAEWDALVAPTETPDAPESDE